MWVHAIASLPRTAPVGGTTLDSVDGGLLCHHLFGVCEDPRYGPPMLRFRCRAAPCHKLNMPHYRGLRNVAV